jgi:D-alanyl-D-alanine carboxypeptidase
MKTLFKKVLLLFVVAIPASSCIKDKAPKPSKVFNVAKFKEELKKNIAKTRTTQPRGYSFVINQNGRWADTCSTGIAYMQAGGNTSPMHPNQEINVASVTKIFTTVAVLQLMKKNSIKLDDPIGQWLPAYFGTVQAVKDITFKQLLTHRSGISEGTGWVDSLKAIAKRGLDNPAKPKDYANMNFAIFRIMIPYMMNKTATLQIEASLVPSQTKKFEEWLSIQYVNYMQNNVFSPIGISSALCSPGVNTAMAFNEGIKISSRVMEDWTQEAGGGGYYLSTMEMARVMAYISHTDILLNKEQRDMMDDNFLGWDTEDSWMTINGQSYGKDGALQWGGPGMQTFVVKYPGNIELSLSVTSWPGDDFRYFTKVAADAYNDSWEWK